MVITVVKIQVGEGYLTKALILILSLFVFNRLEKWTKM